MQELVHVLASADHRGAEIFATQLSDVLTARGWTSRCVALTRGGQRPSLPVPALGSRALGVATLQRLRRDTRGRVVVAHGSTTLPACAIALLGSSPFVYRNIGDPTYWAVDGLRRTRVRVFLRRARFVVALTAAGADALHRLLGVPTSRLVVIPNGVPSERFPLTDPVRRKRARRELQVADGSRLVAYIGALSQEKNVSSAIDAIGLMPDVQLAIMGDGPERDLLERRAQGIAPGRVEFLPPTADPSVLLRAADTLVLPSRTEGMPAVLIEAGLTGLPVVASDVGGVGEIVRDGETGILVPPDDPEQMARGLRAVLDHPDGMGAAARAHCVAHYDLAVVASAWEQLLGRLHGA